MSYTGSQMNAHRGSRGAPAGPRRAPFQRRAPAGSARNFNAMRNAPSGAAEARAYQAGFAAAQAAGKQRLGIFSPESRLRREQYDVGPGSQWDIDHAYWSGTDTLQYANVAGRPDMDYNAMLLKGVVTPSLAAQQEKFALEVIGGQTASAVLKPVRIGGLRYDRVSSGIEIAGRYDVTGINAFRKVGETATTINPTSTTGHTDDVEVQVETWTAESGSLV